jgi:preprotein translocase subunit SecY
MTAGSVLLMWLGELITEQGIGNGISLVIFAGIISQLPTTLGSMITSLVDTSAGTLSVFGWFNLPVNPTAFWVVLGVSLLGLAMLYILVKINEAQRIITVNYAKRVSGNTSYGGIKSILPLMHTYSCRRTPALLVNEPHLGYSHCGKCEMCEVRIAAFAAANTIDPALHDDAFKTLATNVRAD